MIKRKSAKLLIIILTVLTILAILSIGAAVVLQGIWDFIGLNKTNKIPIDAACDITYVNAKYAAQNTNRLISITFIAICLAFVLTALLLVFFIMFVCSYFLDKEKTQEDYLPIVTQFKMYAIYVILWWDLLCVTCNFAYFLSFYLQISTTCNGTVQLKTQEIVLFVLSGLSLILLLIIWILVILINTHVHQYLTDHQIVTQTLKTIHKQTEKPLITDIQMQEKMQLAQARKIIQSSNNVRQSFNRYFESGSNVKTSEKHASPQQKKSILLEVQRDQRRNEEKRQLKSTLLDKNTRDSPKNIVTKNQFYYGNFKELNQRKSPKQQNLVFHKPRFDHPQTPQKNIREVHEDQHNSSKGKLQTSYFREPTIKNRKYESPQIERESKLFRKPVQQQYYDNSKRPSLYFANNKIDGSRYSPINRQKSSPKNSSYARKIDFEQRENGHINRDKNQRSPKSRQNSQKQRKGMMIDYIRERYV